MKLYWSTISRSSVTLIMLISLKTARQSDCVDLHILPSMIMIRLTRLYVSDEACCVFLWIADLFMQLLCFQLSLLFDRVSGIAAA